MKLIDTDRIVRIEFSEGEIAALRTILRDKQPCDHTDFANELYDLLA